MIPHMNGSTADDEDSVYDYEKAKKIKWYHQVLLNRPLKVVLAVLMAAVLAPLLIYQFLFYPSLESPPSDGYSFGSCLLQREARLSCGIGAMNSTECHPQCCYDFNNNICYHRFPSRFSYLLDRNWTEGVTLHPRVATVPFKTQTSVPFLRLSIDEISSTHLSLDFYDSRSFSLDGRRIEDKFYNYHISSDELIIMVNGTQGTIFNTARGPLIASNDIWEITFQLTNETMYGLGEMPLKETVKIIYSHENGLSGIPLIFAKFNGSFHGLLIDVKSPTELRIQGDNQIVVRSITTQGLKFHVFVGPQPEDVMRDVMKHIGYDIKLEYWMLGAHICSEVSQTPTEAFEALSYFIEEASKESLPFESHCGTAPIIFENGLCSEENDFVENGRNILEASKKRFIPHISPFLKFEVNETTEENSTETTKTGEKDCTIPNFEKYMLKQANSTDVYVGTVGDDTVIYPDYGNASRDFMEKLWKTDTKIDGVVLQDSWPLDETYKIHNETYTYLPYFNEKFENAFNHTPQWNISHGDGRRYFYNHNEYGDNFAEAFRDLLGNDTLISSTSQWMNGNVVINRQNINATWTNLQKELTEVAMGGISGQWLWSSPICGDTEHFNNETQTNLCVKWYMAATYLPMTKIHSKSVLRHPLAFVGTNRMLMMTALNRRLTLLPYFFTTLQTGPLLRPMFYQFPSSEALHDLRTQFSVGEALLIIPNLQPRQSHVHVQMPPGSWYELWSGLKLDNEEGETVTMATTEADFLTLIRGGYIVVMQKDVKPTAEETRLHSDFSITIALYCVTANTTQTNSANIGECQASGSLFITKDIIFKFTADSYHLTVTSEQKDLSPICEVSNLISANKLTEIIIYGLDNEHNNYDHYRRVTASADLCDLENRSEIIVTLT